MLVLAFILNLVFYHQIFLFDIVQGVQICMTIVLVSYQIMLLTALQVCRRISLEICRKIQLKIMKKMLILCSHLPARNTKLLLYRCQSEV